MGLAVADLLLQRFVKLDYRFLCVFAWLVYGLLSVLWVSNRGRFQSYYSIYFNNAVMFLLFALIRFTKQETEMLKRAMICGTGALLFYMTFIPDAVIYSSYQYRLTLRAGTEGLDQNYLAALMLISFGLVFYNLCNTQQKKYQRVLSGAFCALILYYIFLTGSRSGLMAAIVIMMLSVNTSWKNRLLIGIPAVVLLFVVFPVIVAYLPEEFLERFSLDALTGKEAESGTRLLIWSKALKSLKGFKWVFGYGVGASQTVIGNVLGRGVDMAIHNHYIAMLVEVGVVGFLLINVPIYKMIVETWKNDKALGVSFIGICLVALFLDVVTTKFFWVAMILLCVCCTCYYNEKGISE